MVPTDGSHDSFVATVKPESHSPYIIQTTVCQHDSPKYPWLEGCMPSFSLTSELCDISSTDLAVTHVRVCMRTVFCMTHTQCDPGLMRTHTTMCLFTLNSEVTYVFAIMSRT